MRCHFTPTRVAVPKKPGTVSATGTLTHCCWERSMIQPFWQTVQQFLGKAVTIPWPSNFHSWGSNQETWTRLQRKPPCTQCSQQHYFEQPILEIAQTFSNTWLKKQNVVYPYDRLSGHKKNWSTDPCHDMDAPWKHELSSRSSTNDPTSGSAPNRQAQRNRKQSSGCQGPEAGKEMKSEC